MKYILSLAIIIGVIALGGWIYFFTKPPITYPDKKITTTIYPLYDITRQVAGDKFEVSLILPPGTSPHSYNPTPQDVLNLNNSSAVFAIGHGLDDWVIAPAKDQGIKEVVVVDKNINLLPSVDDEHVGDMDPHYWLSLTNAESITQTIADTLSAIDPSNQDYYQANAKQYQQKLESEHQFLIQKITESGIKNIATFHNAWNYFSKDLNLNIVATFEPFPGKEPTAQYLNNFRNQINTYQIKTVYAEPQLSSRSIKALQSDLNITIRVLDPIGGSIDRDTYIGLMRYNVGQVIAQ